jgi:hypothetical protein
MKKKSLISLDLEFTGLHADSTVISLSLVSDCGKCFYAEFTDYNKEQVSRMGCKDDVFNNLLYNDMRDCLSYENDFNDYLLKDNTKYILTKLHEWLNKFESIDIIGDCLSWDWVLFCDLFGGAFHIPKNINYIPFDLANLFKFKNVDPDICRLEYLGGIQSLDFEYKKHNSLTDAKMTLACYNKLMEK